MRLKYQTGVSTTVQFILMTMLNFVNGITGTVHDCTHDSGCVGTISLNLVFFLVVSAWFAFICVLGYAAQDRRSKRLAQVLIITEGIVLLAALLDARHYPNILGLITSVTDAALAIWTILLAYRLMRSNGGRVMASTRARRRPTKIS